MGDDLECFKPGVYTFPVFFQENKSHWLDVGFIQQPYKAFMNCVNCFLQRLNVAFMKESFLLFRPYIPTFPCSILPTCHPFLQKLTPPFIFGVPASSSTSRYDLGRYDWLVVYPVGVARPFSRCSGIFVTKCYPRLCKSTNYSE